jgi:hypothetical protein
MRAQILTAPKLTCPLPEHVPAAQERAGEAHQVALRCGALDEAPASTPASADQDHSLPNVPLRTRLSEKEVENLPF